MKKDISLSSNEFFASCPVGLEEALSKELSEIGSITPFLERGGVSFKSSDFTAIKTILYSRIASRVFKKICSFSITSEKDIYKHAVKIPWEKVFSLNQTFKIKTILGNNTKRSFKSSIYLSQLLKDSITDHFTEKSGRRPSVEKREADASILLRVTSKGKNSSNFSASVLIDLCGAPLHQRGYRKKMGLAPLKENLAAGILSLMEWDSANETFIDSMCGSGTFLIEAALKKASIPPTYLKIKKPEFLFLNLPFYLKSDLLKNKLKKELARIKDKIKAGFDYLEDEKISIIGCDINSDVIKQATENILAAGLEEAIKISKKDAFTLTPPKESRGIVFCNPPYGERISDSKELEGLYFNYGENLKANFKGYRAYVFTGNLGLRKCIKLQTSQRLELFNGDIDCRLFKYEMY